MKGQNVDKEDNFFYPDKKDFVELDIHLMSNNYLFGYTTNGICKTKTYSDWVKSFDKLEIPPRSYWTDVNWNKPLELFLHYIAKPDMDVHNGDKATIDYIIGRHYHLDDKQVHAVHNRRVGFCSSYQDGKIKFYIRNIEK